MVTSVADAMTIMTGDLVSTLLCSRKTALTMERRMGRIAESLSSRRPVNDTQ